jgi:predicted DCC family thiol-disulfide oxidoreductase YuxK
MGTPASGSGEAADGPAAIVLFDGVCAFCNGAVDWLMRRDPDGRLRFAPLQGETAARLRARHPEIPTELDTIVLVETVAGRERVCLRSEAVVRACAVIAGAPRWTRWLALVPRPLADLGYRLFTRVRYRVFGRLDACRVPLPGERSRILD